MFYTNVCAQAFSVHLQHAISELALTPGFASAPVESHRLHHRAIALHDVVEVAANFWSSGQSSFFASPSRPPRTRSSAHLFLPANGAKSSRGSPHTSWCQRPAPSCATSSFMMGPAGRPSGAPGSSRGPPLTRCRRSGTSRGAPHACCPRPRAFVALSG